MLSCHCLNVIIETEGDLHKVTAETLGLSEEELQDDFFQEVQQVSKLININKAYSGLIQTRNVGSWVIHCCINCAVHSHAVHRAKGASCVLVNSKLLAEQAIEKTKTSRNYSQIYKIVIDSDDPIGDILSANSYLTSEIENAIKSLKQVAAEGLKDESAKVEARISQFANEQYNKLSNLRERVFREQQALIKLIVDTTEKAIPASTNTGMSNKGMPARLNEPLAAGSVKQASSPRAFNKPAQRHTPKRQKSCPSAPLSSSEDHGVFALDDDVHSSDAEAHVSADSEAEEADETLREEEGVGIPRRDSGASMAKSLPMTIPSFLSAARHRDFDEIEDAQPLEHNEDIAASIKALAKSVHGDTVFGDLPRPRYSYL